MQYSVKKLFNYFKIHKTAIFFWSFFVLIFIGINTASNAAYDRYFRTNGMAVATSTDASSDSSNCNVVGINLHGELITYIPTGNSNDPTANQDIVASESVTSLIQHANQDDKIKAIVIEADSPGGEPVAGEEIADALKSSTKPTVAYIRQSGLSAAYWAISSAGRIFASRNSDVGSIGVTASYTQDINKTKQYVQLSTGKYKDTGNPDKAITADEKALIMRDLQIVYQNFMQDVSVNRNIPLDSVKKIADGSSVLGDRAKELGLVDEIGGLPEVQNYLSKKIGGEASLCWY